ncbi:hypothetical protein [Magnetovibrio sp.]|uniref:hypothetical protein n=1 Tax=Magnetovibrio sp. TaxID=2024836 RepID=UPI002F939A20
MALTADYAAQSKAQIESFDKELCDSARKYWETYPDVAENAFFGRQGGGGCKGAYEHWTRHGRQEGRIWPGNAS